MQNSYCLLVNSYQKLLNFDVVAIARRQLDNVIF